MPEHEHRIGGNPWETFADLLLQRAALVMRVDRNRLPDPLAGLKVDDEDLERLLYELPGLEGSQLSAAHAADVAASLADDVSRAREQLLALTTEDGSGDTFSRLVRSARLSDAGVEVFALLCAVDVDPRRQRLVGYLSDDVTQRQVTAWTLTLLFGPGHLAVVGPGGALRRAALLAPPADTPWGVAPLVLAPLVPWWLAGDRAWDPGLPPGVELVSGTEGPAVAGDVAGFDGSRSIDDSEPVFVATGPDRLRRLQAVVSALGRPSCLVSPVPQGAGQWDALVRQATLAGAGVVLDAADELPPEARDRVERTSHLGWGIVSAHDLPVACLPSRPWHQVPAAGPVATAEEWATAFPGVEQPPYPLSADQLFEVARSAPALGGDLQGAIRRLAAGRIDATAERIQPSRTWDDLVLDDLRTAQVHEIALRCRHQRQVFVEWGFAPQPSTGVVALFAGPSGTGKTLAAEVIAADLGVDLYKIDLAGLVSKYIGETEKNLSKVFDAAEASRVVLFFDEADALFGKRSEVSDAHDRYANIEVAYLLQRLERYEGVAVMATNLAANIDPAFMRRLHVVVEFPMPDLPERRRIWERCFPPGAPLGDDLDTGVLAASAEIAGGTIRNAALGAAFLAAEAGTSIGMDQAVASLHNEMRKIGRLVSSTTLPRR